LGEETKRSIELLEHGMLDTLNGIRKLRGLQPLRAFPEPPFCSFCGEGKNEVGALVEGLNAYICDQCAAEAQRLMRKPLK